MSLFTFPSIQIGQLGYHWTKYNIRSLSQSEKLQRWNGTRKSFKKRTAYVHSKTPLCSYFYNLKSISP